LKDWRREGGKRTRREEEQSERLTFEFSKSTEPLGFLEKQTSEVPPENGDGDVEISD